MEERRDPRPGDTLISKAGGKVLHADWMIGKWQFYVDAYKEAADRLVDQLQEWGSDDHLTLPILFMYRHFVELKLKWIVFHIAWFAGVEAPKVNHDLTGLWKFILGNLDCLGGGLDKKMETGIDGLIKELAILDPSSMTFRYSHNKADQEMPLPESLSMEHFKKNIAILTWGLDYIEGGIDAEKEGRAIEAELEREYQSYLYEYAM
jgi:hypothetical protein